ncbi:MAG TPA: hypothetical protein VK498_12765 [Ferruginibacter sp.]|nr:hypothetical protein [Ferruginibacter sp.]
MKYNERGKKLSKAEMKNVIGGYNRPLGCIVSCCTLYLNFGCIQTAVVAIPSCAPEYIPFGCDVQGCGCSNPV